MTNYLLRNAGYTQSDSSLTLMPVTVIPIYDSKARRKRRKFVILESWLTQTEQKRTALNGGFVESSRGGPPLISWPPSPPQRINVHLADLFAVEPRSPEFDRRKNLARGARVKNKWARYRGWRESVARITFETETFHPPFRHVAELSFFSFLFGRSSSMQHWSDSKFLNFYFSPNRSSRKIREFDTS